MSVHDVDIMTHSPDVRDRGTWGREARRVILLAAEAGLAVDDEAVVLSDVRELMALRARLQYRLTHPQRRRWAGRLGGIGRRVAARFLRRPGS